MHPIDTSVALGTLGWDVLNAYTKVNYGIALADSMERNAIRMQSIKNGLVEMSHADGPALTKMIMRELTVGIFSAGVGSGVGRAAVFARGVTVGRRVASEVGMFAKSSEGMMQLVTKHPLTGLSPDNVVRLVAELGSKTPKD